MRGQRPNALGSPMTLSSSPTSFSVKQKQKNHFLLLSPCVLCDFKITFHFINRRKGAAPVVHRFLSSPLHPPTNDFSRPFHFRRRPADR